jgi:hypothetical protein
MRHREDVPVHAVIDGLEFDTTVDVENAIPVPLEMTDGRVQIRIDTGDLQGAQLDGIREFVPDVSSVLRQLPLLSWLPTIPRPGSAMMIGAIFRLALMVTEDVPELADERAAIQDYYEAHVDDWMVIAEQAERLQECGAKYYGVHIAYIAAHTWARFEQGARADRIRGELMDERLWDDVRDHKNAYFAFLWAGVHAGANAGEISAAVEQLVQYPPGPRLATPQDHVDEYPHDPACTSGGAPQAAKTTAVDVRDRVVDGFIWQRHPWGLLSGGDLALMFSGVDYLAAYWAARQFAPAHLPDDRPGTCSRYEE